MSVFRLDKDTMSPELRRLAARVRQPKVLFEAGAKAVQKGIVGHLRRLQGRGNKMGWPSRKFFAGAGDSVEHRVGVSRLDDRGAVITIADPRFVHRIEGGVVTPKRRKYLIIPLNAQAYALAGKGSVRESAPWLVLRFPFLGKVTGDNFEKWFLLARRVTHSAHPEELPDKAELGAQARQAMTRAARILLRARGA